MKDKVLHRCGEEIGDEMAMALLHKGTESFGFPWPRGHVWGKENWKLSMSDRRSE